MKGVGELSHQLGARFRRGIRPSDPEKDVYVIDMQSYITEVLRKIEEHHGTLRLHKTPLPPGDHPEEVAEDPLDHIEKRHYQQLIGMANWLVTMGRLDIHHAVTTLAHPI
eukprot:scaffold3504_cov240-Pinguiococcus_pyrenoidosus.AAC.69